MRKPGRNEPCWCGSGNKYKKCHLNRSSEEALSKSRIIAELKPKRPHKECMHPNAGSDDCDKRIIDAHTIQRKGPLKSIVDESNHVFCFGTDKHGEAEISKLGWKKASTFKGFCAKHDKEMFRPIEDVPYGGSRSQCFLVGYRAVALEYVKKISAVNSLQVMSRGIDRGRPYERQIHVQGHLNSYKQNLLKGIDPLKETLSIYRNNYKLQNYDDFEGLSIYFTGELSLAVSGCFSPDFTIEGRQIQTVAPDVEFTENIAINTLNTKDGHSLVFSWPKTFTKCTEFIDSLINVKHETFQAY